MDLFHKLVMHQGHSFASRTGIPAPQHQLVVRDMLDELFGMEESRLGPPLGMVAPGTCDGA